MFFSVFVDLLPCESVEKTNRTSGLYTHIDSVGDESEWLGCWGGGGGDAVPQTVVERDACRRPDPLVNFGCGLASDRGVAHQ